MTPLCPHCFGSVKNHMPGCRAMRKTTIELPFSQEDVKNGAARRSAVYDPKLNFNTETMNYEIMGPSAATIAQDIQTAFAKDVEGKMRAALIELGWTPPNASDDDIVKRLKTKANMIIMGEKITFGSEAALMDEAAAEIEGLQRRLDDIRRYLIPMSTWVDLDAHARGHVEMMLTFSDYRPGTKSGT